MLAMKRRLADALCVTKQYIRPQLVNRALEYLKRENPLYRTVQVYDTWADDSLALDKSWWTAATEPTEGKTVNNTNDSDNSITDSEDELKK